MRFIGFKNNRIRVISNTSFSNPSMVTVEIQDELSDVTDAELLCDYRVRGTSLIHKKNHRDAQKLKIALVGNWKMQCGISTYSENLWPEVAKRVGDVRLFIEENPNPTGDLLDLGGKILPQSSVVTCWKRGESPALLIHEIRNYDPDIIWFQHEFGLWPNARFWLSMMSQLQDYRCIVTMHSVFHHRDKTICEAAMPEIIVHLDGARTILQNEKQIQSRIHVVPHGCYPCTSRNKLWNFYKSEHTFLQFGFGFRYKGWEKAIQATSILRQKYPDVFFTGLFSESPFGKLEHQIYYNELTDLIESLGLQENVAIIRGFQSESTIDSFIRTNQVTLFPYVSNPEHEVWGASGAARMAMSKSAPVVTSKVNHFSDLPSIKADSPEEIADAVNVMFDDSQARESQVRKQLSFIEKYSWANTAQMHVELFQNHK